MNRFRLATIFCLSLFLSCAAISAEDDVQMTPGDASSNALEQEVDEGDLSPNAAATDIDEDDFDSANGGLYCPNNQCNKDPSDVSNGF